jgi:hypothetical protein
MSKPMLARFRTAVDAATTLRLAAMTFLVALLLLTACRYRLSLRWAGIGLELTPAASDVPRESEASAFVVKTRDAQCARTRSSVQTHEVE